jgi:ATP adenylyltransferase
MGYQIHNNDYNIILTKRYMLMVMRQSEGVKNEEKPNVNITLNSLGFAGTMAVKNEESLEYIKELTPLGVLERISLPSTDEVDI